MLYKKQYAILLLCIAFLFSLMPVHALAHPVNLAMEKAPPHEVFWFYMKMGITHIIPEGLDHILFVVSLCLLSNKIKTILWQATAFTVAHSITLALAAKNIIVAPSQLVEPIISLSIMFVAIENIIISELKPWRVLIVFFFGLIHGLGFASALSNVGLPRIQFYTSVIAFNVGRRAWANFCNHFSVSFAHDTFRKKGQLQKTICISAFHSHCNHCRLLDV